MNLANDIKITIRENKPAANSEAPRFSLSYAPITRDVDIAKLKKHSFAILSALKGNDKDAVIEIDSALLNVQKSQREDIALNFVRAVRTKQIEFRYDKTPEKASFFSQLFKANSSTPSFHHHILAYIDSDIWNSDDFFDMLPVEGVRYYITPPVEDKGKILDDLRQGYILEDEKLDAFELIIFDCCAFGQMGLYTKQLSLDEIKERLKDFL